MKHKFTALGITLWIVTAAYTQGVGIGTNTPSASAQLDVSSTSKGFLMPRMTTAQRNAIVTPARGLQVFNLDDLCTDIFDGANWIKNCGYKQTDTLNLPEDSWVQRANFGGSLRQEAVGFSIGNKGYTGTGNTSAEKYPISKSDFWEFDPSTDVWTQKADFGGGQRRSLVGFSIGTKGYVGTGEDSNKAYKNDFWEYDPVLNSWTQKAHFGGIERTDAVGFSIGTKGYIGTGLGYTDRVVYYKDFWEYDPTNNVWTPRLDFGGTVRGAATGFSIGTKGYIGTGNDGTDRNDFWEFTPGGGKLGNGTWNQKDVVGGSERHGAVGFSIGSKGYIGTGISYLTGALNDFWEYDSLTEVWTQKANLSGTARGWAIGFSIGTQGYIGTGSNGFDNVYNDFWKYNTQPGSVPVYSSANLPFEYAVNEGIWSKTGTTVYNTAGGNVGIGTSTPSEKLDVDGKIKIAALQLPTGAANGKVLTSDALGNGKWSLPATQYWELSGNNISNSNSGNIGIGTSSPTSSLDINGQLTIDQKNFGGYGGLLIKGDAPGSKYPNICFSIKNNNATPQDIIAGYIGGNINSNIAGSEAMDLSFFTSATGLSGLTERLRIKDNGNVGIGNNTPAYKLDVAGDINASGQVRANGIALSSDARYKQNITTLPNALHNLLQLRGASYFFNAQAFPAMNFSSAEQIGLIAQEVEKVFPELVTVNADGYRSVNYIGLIPVMIESIKAQQKQIDRQDQQIQQLTQLLNKFLH